MAIQKNEKKPLFKVALLGDTQTGKTNLIRRFLYDNFLPTNPTIGPDLVANEDIDIYQSGDERVPVTLQVWDTAGLQKHQGLSDRFYVQMDATVIVLTPDPNNPNAILNQDAVAGYYGTIKKFGSFAAPIYVVINKSDLLTGGRDKIIADIRRELGNDEIPVLFCSAKKDNIQDNTTVRRLFTTIATNLYERQPASLVIQENFTTTGATKNSPHFPSSSGLWDDRFADFASFVTHHKIWASGNLLLAVAAIITLIALAALPIGGLSLLTGLTVLGVAAIATGGAFVVWNALCLIGNLIKGNDGDGSDNLADDSDHSDHSNHNSDYDDSAEQSFEYERHDQNNTLNQNYGGSVYHQSPPPKTANTDDEQQTPTKGVRGNGNIV